MTGDRPDSLVVGNSLVDALDDPIGDDVRLYDETLRDGEQTVGVAFSPENKIEIAQSLLDAGIEWLTVGFPAVSREEQETVRTIGQRGRAERMYCFARALQSDVEAVMACEMQNIIMFIAISDVHLQHKLHMTPDQAFQRMQDQIRFARSFGLNVRFAFEDASRAPLERIRRFIGGALEAGATMITFADTCGVMTPLASYRVVAEIVKITGDVPLAVHFHDDFGLATANTVMACAAGARFAMGAMNGLGERAGNAPLEELAAVLSLKYGVPLGVDLAGLVRLAGRIAEIARFPTATNKPILGANVFAHESGIHVHGITQEPATYEAFSPTLVGRSHEVRFGKHSGLSNIRYIASTYGIEASDQALSQVLASVKSLGQSGRPPTESEVVTLLEQVVRDFRTREEGHV